MLETAKASARGFLGLRLGGAAADLAGPIGPLVQPAQGPLDLGQPGVELVQLVLVALCLVPP